jgi:hypothetical protein
LSVTVKVRNKDKLARKFKALAPEAARAMAAVNEQSANDMVAIAKGFVPIRTGTLRNSIRAEPAGGTVETGAWRVLAGGPATTRPARNGHGSYDYALGVEFGTSDTPRQSFFFTSYRLIKRRHRARATRAVNQANKRVAGK